jgi:hypothetical protein
MMHSKIVDHSRLNSQHNLEGGGSYMIIKFEERIFTLTMKDSHASSEKYEEKNYGHNLDLQTISH